MAIRTSALVYPAPRGVARRGSPIRFEHVLDRETEQPRDGEGQRQAGVVTQFLDRIDRLSRDSQSLRELRLRPAALRAKQAEPVLHRYLQCAKSSAGT